MAKDPEIVENYIMKILFIGDVVAKLGRETVGKILPDLLSKHDVDLVIANAENSAHGKGTTVDVLKELQGYGVKYFTGGNHIFWQKSLLDHLDDLPLVRPANYINAPGKGHDVVDLGANGQVLIINLVGMAFMQGTTTLNPFIYIDNILDSVNPDHYKAIIVDFHAEASSEKVLMGHYLDGRVTAVLGTHWHVPTADNRVLEAGTAYISDVGMVGAENESLGVDKKIAFERLKSPIPQKSEWVEEGQAVFNSVLIETENVGMKAKNITRVDFWDIL